MPRGSYKRGPAQRGKRVELPAPIPLSTGSSTYVCGHKPLLMGTRVLHEGVEVPGAKDWTRLEAWVAARRIRVLRPDEDYTTFADFCQTWDQQHGIQDELPLEDLMLAEVTPNLELATKE